MSLFSKPLRLALALTLFTAPFLPGGFFAGWLVGSYLGTTYGLAEFHSASTGAAVGFVFGGLGIGLVIGLALHHRFQSFGFRHIAALTVAWGIACTIAASGMLFFSFLHVPSIYQSP
jgi:hypothetical protein